MTCFPAPLIAAIDWPYVFFLLTSLVTCGFALLVVFSSNVVRMAFSLVLSLAATAGLFFLAGAEFVGAMQLMIYVGGTLVLLIFGVMLTAQKRFVSMKTAAGDWVLAAAVGGSLLALLVGSALKVDAWRTPRESSSPIAVQPTTAQLGAALSGVRLDRLGEADAVRRRGMSGYALPFVIVSMHLLVVLIGASYLARAKRSAVAEA